MSKTRELVPDAPPADTLPAAAPLAARELAPLLFVPTVRRVHPGLRPYPSLRFDPELDVQERGARFAQALLRRLRIWRVEQRLTREALAELTTLPASAIKRAERSGRLSLERFIILALQLGLEDDLADLFAFRRNRVPVLVLAARTARRKNGRRAERDRARRRGRA